MSIDLRDFQFMPLDVQRLRDSDLAALASGDEFRAAVLLWCAAWHQVPAGSLPADDKMLAHLAGYGRDIEAWVAVREMALHGFEDGEDGRLYHHVICEKAGESWGKKRAQRQRTAAATKARKEKTAQRNDNRNDNRNDERNDERDEPPGGPADEQRDVDREEQHKPHQGTGTVKGDSSVSSLRSDTAAAPPDDLLEYPLFTIVEAKDDPNGALFGPGLRWLTARHRQLGRPPPARSLIADWLKHAGQDGRAVWDLLVECQRGVNGDPVGDPVSWMYARLNGTPDLDYDAINARLDAEATA